MKKRNIILGIDGIPYELIDKLSNKGIMPNFRDLKKEFYFKRMNSSIPHISSVSWSSIITGKNPGEHGIFGFMELIPNTYTLSFPNFNALKCNPFWHNYPEKKHIIINVPSTYPAKKINGIHISGFVALELEKSVYPKKYLSILKDIEYEIDVDTSLAHQQSEEFFINELFRVLEIRKKSFDRFWNELTWDNFMAIITSSDRLGHYLWNIYEDQNHELHYRILEFFREIDNIIGDFTNRLDNNDTFIILSDHGMERNDCNVNINTYLEKEGLLSLSQSFKRYNRIKEGSKAFSLDPGRVYLNRQERYPNGSVLEKEEKEIIEELKTLFYDLKFNNQKIIKKIYAREEVYSGKMIRYAPDLILMENKGFQLKGSIGREKIFEKENKILGKHDDNAFLFVNKDIELENPDVTDVISLME